MFVPCMGSKRHRGIHWCHGQLHKHRLGEAEFLGDSHWTTTEVHKFLSLCLPVFNSTLQGTDLFLGAWARSTNRTPWGLCLCCGAETHFTQVVSWKEKINSPNQPWQSNYIAGGGGRKWGGRRGGDIKGVFLAYIWLRTFFLLIGKCIWLWSEWLHAVLAPLLLRF